MRISLQQGVGVSIHHGLEVHASGNPRPIADESQLMRWSQEVALTDLRTI